MAKLKKSKILYNHRRKHPAVVFEDIGSEYGFIGITHRRFTHGVENVKLPENVEKDDSSPSYARPNPMTDKKRVFSPHKRKLRIGRKNWYWLNKIKKNPYKK